MSVTNNFNGVSGRFACVYGGIRTEEFTHGDDGKAISKAITLAPAEVSGWLVLADMLADQCNPAEHMVRVLFQEGYEPPVGFRGEITRGSRYWSNGCNHVEGRTYSWGDDRDGWDRRGFTHHYWSNGSTRSEVSRAEALAALTKIGGIYVDKFWNLTITGSLRPSYRIVPCGSKVIATKLGSEKSVVHETTSTIKIPADARRAYHVWAGMQTTCLEFDHMGYQVAVSFDKIQSVVEC